MNSVFGEIYAGVRELKTLKRFLFLFCFLGYFLLGQGDGSIGKVFATPEFNPP